MKEGESLSSVASNPGGFCVDESFFRECFGNHRPFNARMFEKGCLCPALVLTTSPCLVAVYTDLRTGSQSLPCVRIVEQPLEKQAPKPGQHLAACALYYSGSSEGRWATFDPVVVNCATRDAASIQAAQEAIPEADWNRLMELLGKTALPYDSGVQFLFTPAGELSHREFYPLKFPEKAVRFASSPTSVSHGSIPILTLIFSPFLGIVGWVLWDSYQKAWLPIQQEPGMGFLSSAW